MPCYAIGNQTALHHHTRHTDKCTGLLRTQSVSSFWDQKRVNLLASSAGNRPRMCLSWSTSTTCSRSPHDDVTSCVWPQYCFHRPNRRTYTPERGFKLYMVASWIQKITQKGRRAVTNKFPVPAVVSRQPAYRGREHLYCVIFSTRSPQPSQYPGDKTRAERSRCSRQASFVSPREHLLHTAGVQGGGGWGPGRATIAHVLMIPKCCFSRSRRVPWQWCDPP